MKAHEELEVNGVYGKVNLSIGYRYDEPHNILLSFSQHRKEENSNQDFNAVTLYQEDLKLLVDMLKENELI